MATPIIRTLGFSSLIPEVDRSKPPESLAETGKRQVSRKGAKAQSQDNSEVTMTYYECLQHIPSYFAPSRLRVTPLLDCLPFELPTKEKSWKFAD
ncbi:MAG: hypothetical protein WEB58_21495 [Planctomycetaceae bacterium]